MDVGKRIKYFRELKSYSVNKLANKAGISQSYLREVELGKKKPSVEILSYICDALNVSLRDFFDNEYCIDNDSLQEKIFQLNKSQRIALSSFLDTMLNTDNSWIFVYYF